MIVFYLQLTRLVMLVKAEAFSVRVARVANKENMQAKLGE